MGARHGATILLTPRFKGFNTMLWIVPIGVSLFGFAFVLWGQFRSKRQPIDKAQ
jgi:cytochrome c-type biogenesis protein CcmH/NrfF